MIKAKLKLVTVLVLMLSLTLAAQAQTQGIPPIPETAQYYIDLADIYARVFPESAEIEVVAAIWLRCDGVNPVIMKIGGNLKNMKIEGRTQPNLNFVMYKPYIHFYNMNYGSHQVVFTYRAKHDGITSSGTISLAGAQLPQESYWYPRNVADDPHQVILNVETPQGYPMTTNGALAKEAPNNLWWLRQFILSTASASGMVIN